MAHHHHPCLPPPAAEQYVIATAEEVSEATNTVEYYHMNGGCCLKVLAAMSHGLRDNDGNHVLSLEGDLWKTIPLKQIRPNKDEYKNEVIRR